MRKSRNYSFNVIVSNIKINSKAQIGELKTPNNWIGEI